MFGGKLKMPLNSTIIHYAVWFNQTNFLLKFDFSELGQIQYFLIDHLLEEALI